MTSNVVVVVVVFFFNRFFKFVDFAFSANDCMRVLANNLKQIAFLVAL